jgi:hypothetical protein
MHDRITYQLIGYEDTGAIPRLGQIAVLRTPYKRLARFLSMQLLTWQYTQDDPDGEEPIGYCVELYRGRCQGPLDTGLWTPERHDDPAADIAYLDPDTGSIEWQANAPTYLVITEDPHSDSGVIDLSKRRR